MEKNEEGLFVKSGDDTSKIIVVTAESFQDTGNNDSSLCPVLCYRQFPEYVNEVSLPAEVIKATGRDEILVYSTVGMLAKGILKDEGWNTRHIRRKRRNLSWKLIEAPAELEFYEHVGKKYSTMNSK
jgi:hypothetical protein